MKQRQKLKKKYNTSRIGGTAREIRLERCVVECDGFSGVRLLVSVVNKLL
jgi:hypothetical protein